jgi:hypothetical protein
MTVKDLIELLETMPPEKRVELTIQWSGDIATTDEDDVLTVSFDEDCVRISGWMSNCGTELHFLD